jgi:hypothetical protein
MGAAGRGKPQAVSVKDIVRPKMVSRYDQKRPKRASTNVGFQAADASDASVVRAHELLPWNWSKSA